MGNEELVVLYQNGSEQALSELIMANRGLITKLASHYHNSCPSFLFDVEDLIQVGYIGMIKAADKYDTTLEPRANFVTYAFYWVEREIKNLIFGTNKKDKLNADLNNSCARLNEPLTIDEEIGGEIIDLIPTTTDEYLELDLQLWMKHLRTKLDEYMLQYTRLREREVLKMLSGWDSKPMSLTDVSEVLFVTPQRVRQIRNDAYRKLRRLPQVKQLKNEYLGDEDAFNLHDPAEVVVSRCI